jgi:circadian clock protein KaiC
MPPTVKREVLQEVMIEKVKTRIAGLDELLDGGFPKGRVISIIGSPGTGKTILSTQFIMNGILDYGENGLYISLDERKQHYIEEMGSFGWDLEKLEKEM